MPLYTKEEWDAAHAGFKAELQSKTEIIQRLCVEVALHKPIRVSWRPNDAPKPWGCILVKESNPGYCDECPVQHDCPKPYKQWSK